MRGGRRGWKMAGKILDGRHKGNTSGKYGRDCLLGCVGLFLMLIGDWCLSVVPASPGDSGLIARQAYVDGAFQAWRLPLLTAAGLLGMAFCFFAVRVTYEQIRPQYRKMRKTVQIGGAIYLTSAGALHFFIGCLADWVGILAPLLGGDKAIEVVTAWYERILPAMLLSYMGMVLLILVSAWAVLTEKTILPRKMFVFHMLVFQIIFAVIPDLRQLCGADPATVDFVLSQGSGNAAMLLWLLANAIWARSHPEAAGEATVSEKEVQSHG